MDKMLLDAYIRLVHEQATFGVGVHGEALRAKDDSLWFYLQAFVNCAANVSKLLWGQNGKFSDERAPVRALIGVRDDSALRPTLMRNHYEHFDERIALWWNLPEPKIYIDRNIGDARGGIRVVSDKAQNWFRNYDPETGGLSFWGDEINVHAVASELADLRDKASQASAALMGRSGQP